MILADGENVRDLIPADESIRLVELEGAPQIGEKRNFGCELAGGETIAHWDDDDYSAPGRLDDQVALLLETGKAVTGYNSMKFTDGRQWWQFRHHGPQNALGTSLCYSRAWWRTHPFRYLKVGEDNFFVLEAVHARQLVTVDAGDLMYATIHPKNTSPRSLSGSLWKLLAT